MASPRRAPHPAPAPPPAAAALVPAPAPAPVPAGERVAITIKPERTNKVDKPTDPEKPQPQKIENAPKLQKPPPRTSSIDSNKTKLDDQCYVKNSSFLSRDIQAQKSKVEPINVLNSKPESPIVKDAPPRAKSEADSPPRKSILSPPKKKSPPPKNDVMSPTKTESASPPKMRLVSPPKKESNSPPVATFKIKKNEEMVIASKMSIKEPGIIKELPLKIEKLSIADSGIPLDNAINKIEDTNDPGEAVGGAGAATNEESNGVGDKIKKFEKAAEDASALPGRQSRPGSVRGRGRTERLGSDPKEDLPPPATPFKDNVHFELGTLVRQQSVSKNSPPNLPKWPRENQPAEMKKPEPQKIIKPEFKPMPSPVDVTIRSPSLGSKLPDQFPSHGTAFRNVASPAPDAARASHKFTEDLAPNNFKGCKTKPKEKYSVSKGSSYFTRGSEEIWLVKKKDIEEIEERVLDSFRRAGGNVCVRSESLRPASDGGHAHAGHSHAGHAGHAGHAPPAFTHATMGRKRQMYSRSESLDPPWAGAGAGARAQTLKRQTSVACTCGHDKKPRAASAGPAAAGEAAPRPRSRSHGDDNHHHVLDKYETLV